MTTATKKAAGKTKKAAPKRTGRRNGMPPVPPTANVVEIAGREYVIAPLDDYDEWLQDQLLAAIASERMAREGNLTIPWTEARKRLAGKKSK